MIRKNITWKPNARKNPVEPRYYEDRSFRSIPEDQRGLYEKYLYTGALWMLKHNAFVWSENQQIKQHQYPYVGHMKYSTDKRIPENTLAIYMGQTRVEEKDPRMGTMLCPLRHTLLIEGSMYITIDLCAYFQPAEMQSIHQG